MAAHRDTLYLVTGGRRYDGWKEVMISTGIEQAAGGFEISLTETWTGQSTPWPLREGDACTVQIGDDVVITGYIDDADDDREADSHGVRVTGRDSTADLVDCSAVHSPDEWSLPLDEVAAILAEPFGVTVRVDDGVDVGARFSPYKLEQGETAWEAIERGCRLRGLLAISDGRGGLVLTTPGTSRAATHLIYGQNLLGVKRTTSLRDRYSDYVVKGQMPGSDEVDDDTARSAKGEARDEGVPRYRPLLVLAEGSADSATAGTRAAWECTVRRARGLRYTARVQGWRQSDGSLWRLNQLVSITVGTETAELLIAAIRYRLSERGTTTELELVAPDAFTPEPVKAATSGGGYLPSGVERITAGSSGKTSQTKVERIKA